MAGQFNNEEEEVIADINMTPLIDIMLVLLILFMVTSSVSFQTGVDVDLPEISEASESSSSAPDAIIITINRDGALFLQGEPIAFDDLSAALSQTMEQMNTRFVILEGDQQASLGNTVNIMDIAKAAGAEKFAIAASEN